MIFRSLSRLVVLIIGVVVLAEIVVLEHVALQVSRGSGGNGDDARPYSAGEGFAARARGVDLNGAPGSRQFSDKRRWWAQRLSCARLCANKSECGGKPVVLSFHISLRGVWVSTSRSLFKEAALDRFGFNHTLETWHRFGQYRPKIS